MTACFLNIDKDRHNLINTLSLYICFPSVFVDAYVRRSKKVIKLVPEYLLKKRKTYQAIKATQAKLALLEKRKASDDGVLGV